MIAVHAISARTFRCYDVSAQGRFGVDILAWGRFGATFRSGDVLARKCFRNEDVFISHVLISEFYSGIINGCLCLVSLNSIHLRFKRINY